MTDRLRRQRVAVLVDAMRTYVGSRFGAWPDYAEERFRSWVETFPDEDLALYAEEPRFLVSGVPKEGDRVAACAHVVERVREEGGLGTLLPFRLVPPVRRDDRVLFYGSLCVPCFKLVEERIGPPPSDPDREFEARRLMGAVFAGMCDGEVTA